MRVQSVRWKIARRHLNQQAPHRLRWLLAIAVVVMSAATTAGVAGAAYFVSQLPATNAFQMRYGFQNARIYDSHGRLLYTMAALNQGQVLLVVGPEVNPTPVKSGSMSA